MGCEWNSPKTIQLFCLVGSAFVIAMSVVRLSVPPATNPLIIFNSIFSIIFGALLLLVELYVFSFFGYFTFIITYWGKTFMYLFMGFLLFDSGTVGIIAAIGCWVVAVLMFIAGFVVKGCAPPIFQRGGPPDMTVSSVYEVESTQ